MAAVVLYLTLTLAFYLFATRILHKIRNLPPSPLPSLPVIGHLYLFKKPLHRSLARISARRGPVLLLQFGSRRVLLVSSPSAAADCFTRNDIAFANRPNLLSGKIQGDNYTTLVWAPYGDHWRNLRRIASIEILSSHRLQMLSEIRADEVRLLLVRLHRAAGGGEVVDMKANFFDLMVNVMMRMIAGKRYRVEEAEEEGVRLRELVEELFRLGGASNVGDFLPVLRWIGVEGVEKKLKALREKRKRFSQAWIEEHRRRKKTEYEDEKGGKKKTMIEVLLSLQEAEPEHYTDRMIDGYIWVTTPFPFGNCRIFFLNSNY